MTIFDFMRTRSDGKPYKKPSQLTVTINKRLYNVWPTINGKYSFKPKPNDFSGRKINIDRESERNRVRQRIFSISQYCQLLLFSIIIRCIYLLGLMLLLSDYIGSVHEYNVSKRRARVENDEWKMNIKASL